MDERGPEYLIGCQTPRYASPVTGDTTRGDQAVEFAKAIGLTLYPWQNDLLRDMCRTSPAGLWNYPEVVVSVARQNGKGEVLIARELAGVFLFGEKTVLHTAHFLDTAIDARNRTWSVMSQVPELMRWWGKARKPRCMHGNGKAAIIFPGQSPQDDRIIYYRTRTVKTGRGLSIDLLVYDECFYLPNEVWSAMDSTTNARPNAQKIFISSPVNSQVHDHGVVFSAKRWNGIDQVDGTLFREWSADTTTCDPFSLEALKQANPSLVDQPKPGVQLRAVTAAARTAEKNPQLATKYFTEILGVGEWFSRDGSYETGRETIIDLSRWNSCVASAPQMVGESCVGVDISPGGARGAIVAALAKPDGGVHLMLHEVCVFDRAGFVEACVSAVDNNDPAAIVMDMKTPASTLETLLASAGIEPETVTMTQLVEATELFLALVIEGKITHDGNPRWVEAITAADYRTTTGTAGKGRALRAVDGCISELVAATLAVWGLDKFLSTPETMINRTPIYTAPPPVGVETTTTTHDSGMYNAPVGVSGMAF